MNKPALCFLTCTFIPATVVCARLAEESAGYVILRCPFFCYLKKTSRVLQQNIVFLKSTSSKP